MHNLYRTLVTKCRRCPQREIRPAPAGGRHDRRRAVRAPRLPGDAMDELSDATGLRSGGLYHYIGSKRALLLAIFSELMDPLLEQASAIETGTPEEQLRQLVRAWVAHIEAHLDHMAVFAQERHAIEHEPEWEDVRASRDAFEAILARRLAEVGITDRLAALRPARHGQPHRHVAEARRPADRAADRGRLLRPDLESDPPRDQPGRARPAPSGPRGVVHAAQPRAAPRRPLRHRGRARLRARRRARRLRADRPAVGRSRPSPTSARSAGCSWTRASAAAASDAPCSRPRSSRPRSTACAS